MSRIDEIKARREVITDYAVQTSLRPHFFRAVTREVTAFPIAAATEPDIYTAYVRDENDAKFFTYAPADVDFLLAEVDRLRQGLWDCAKYAGADLDGDETPRAFVGDLVPYVVGIIKEQRGEYDELLNELPLSKSESEL